MAVPRRGVVETEQERQWKQLQAHRQQQQQQQLASGGQMVPLGGHVPVPAGSMAMPPGQPDTVIAQQQQQQQILQQQPPMPNQQQQQQQQQLGGGFATPIQVSRVRAPGEPLNGPTAPVFMLRGPGNAPNVQQQTAVVPTSTMVMAPDGVEGVDPSVVVSGGVIVEEDGSSEATGVSDGCTWFGLGTGKSFCLRSPPRISTLKPNYIILTESLLLP